LETKRKRSPAMSHQSGIQASPELLKAFNDAVHNNDIRLMKISIVNESVVLSNSLPVRGTWQDDFGGIVDQFEEKTPCYVIYRLDEKSHTGSSWILCCYVPDHAYVRDKMLYASTRATFKKTLGDAYFVDEVYGTDKHEFTLEGYNKHRKSVTAAPALTEREEEMQRMKKEESGAEIGITTKKAHVHGVYFPFSGNAETQMRNLQNGSVNYIQLTLDTEREIIELVSSKSLDVSEIKSLTPQDKPSYHFFKFRHAFEDNTIESIIFIYSCPMSSKVKERMLFSSCKASVISVAESLGLVIDKNSEISEPNELTETFVYEELHPKKPDEKKTFKKPMKPGRPGTKKGAIDDSNE
jgi:twinfilin-like protein